MLRLPALWSVLMTLAETLAQSDPAPSVSGRIFTTYTDRAPDTTSNVPLDVISGVATSGSLRCHGACVRRADCLAFWISAASDGGVCRLYASYVDQPAASQLQTAAGDVFFNIAPSIKHSYSTDTSTLSNGGWANVFYDHPLKKGGRVLRWVVRCSEAGVIYLAVWRGDVAASITLIAKHRVTVTSAMVGELVTYDVPASESFVVEAGDLMGIHYDDQGNGVAEARVMFPAIKAPFKGLRKKFSIYDGALPIGAVVPASSLLDVSNKIPSLALYVG